MAHLIDLVIYLIVVDAVLSWFQQDHQFPKSITATMLAPIYKQTRKLIGQGPVSGLDITPLILIIALNVLQSILR